MQLTFVKELLLAASDGLLQLLALGQLTDHLSQYRYIVRLRVSNLRKVDMMSYSEYIYL